MVGIAITLIICGTALWAHRRHDRFQRDRLTHTDHVYLEVQLRQRLKEVEDLKPKIETLLIKNGLISLREGSVKTL